MVRLCGDELNDPPGLRNPEFKGGRVMWLAMKIICVAINGTVNEQNTAVLQVGCKIERNPLTDKLDQHTNYCILLKTTNLQSSVQS
jgi:hypothetical protein